MIKNAENSISSAELNRQFDWFQNEFSDLVQTTFNDFFADKFELRFIGLSKNINCLQDNEACFVSKAQIAPEYEVFFRLTETAVKIILDDTLGESVKRFKIKDISDLESKIITSFNGTLFGLLKDKINDPDPKELQRTNLDIINLTFVLRNNNDSDKRAGKFTISIPLALIVPTEIDTSAQGIYTEDDFPESETYVKIAVGSTRFSLYEIKNLEQDDLVVFENSDIEHLQIINNDERIDFTLNPNLNILMPEQEQNGGETMDNSNLWDSIQVDMNGEFDSVKITLAELKNIQKGMVMDIASLYDNKVTLKVEGKPVASGSLVIINDKYGVKIENVISQDGTPAPEAASDNQIQNDDSGEMFEEQEEFEEQEPEEGAEEGGEEGGEEEFDYSDFELEDENI